MQIPSMRMDKDQYRAALRNLGMSQHTAAGLFGVTGKTSQNWALGKTRIPRIGRAAAPLLRQARPEALGRALARGRRHVESAHAAYPRAPIVISHRARPARAPARRPSPLKKLASENIPTKNGSALAISLVSSLVHFGFMPGHGGQGARKRWFVQQTHH
jgi:hypothetical protein